MGDGPRLLLLDGHSLAYRAFYALPVENFSTTGGQHTNAIYGFASMLANVLRDERPTHLAVAFDVSRQTFRAAEFPDYKANRTRSPGEFHSQMKILDELLAVMRITTLRIPGYEADDVIATLVTEAEAAGFEALVLTGDRDALQLISDRVTVLYYHRSSTELTRFTPELVMQRYGLTPRQYPDFAALRGDPSDNLPSIPGIGEKTAAKWIREYGSFAALAENAGAIPGKAGEKLRAGLPAATLNRRLTELVRDVDLPVTVADLARRPYDLTAFSALLDDLEFRNASLRERLFAADPGGGAGDGEAAGGAEAAPMAKLKGRELRPGELASWLAARASADDPTGIALDQNWARGAGRIARIALAAGAGEAGSAGRAGPAGHAASFEPDRLSAADERAFAGWLADPARPKAVHALKSVLRVLPEHGWTIGGVAFDVEMAAYLLKPGLVAYGIADLAAHYLGRRPPAEGAAGLMLRAGAVRELTELFTGELAGTGMDRLLHEVELPLAGLLARMERTGVHVDQELLHELEGQFAAEMERTAERAGRIAGRPFNPGSTKQLNEVLFQELGLPRTKKIKSGFSTDEDALLWLATRTDNGLPELLLHHRAQAGLRTTVAGLIREMGVDGRIHTNFQQTVAATGRLTSAEPNLQVIPIRTAEGRRIRRAFLPGPGYESIMTADYNQLELRIMAHLSADAALIAAFESGEDLHTTIAAQVFEIPKERVGADQRRKIKAMSYGLAYGLSTFGLAKQLRIGFDEAKPLMDAYFARFGGVRDYLHAAVEQARETGYTQTVLGRRRYLPSLTSDNKQRRETAERMALNAPIQGSAADIVKIMMLRLDAELAAAGLGSRLLLQVHDEIVLEIAPGERDRVAELVHAQMIGAYPLSVRLEVDIGTGRDWDDAAH